MKPLVIIGASYLQLPLVTRAREKGYETHVFAWEESALAKNHCDRFYPISITDIEGIEEICDRLNPVGIVTIASDLAAVTVQKLARRYGHPGNSDGAMQKTSNKGVMRKAFSTAGLPSPRFRVFGSSSTGMDAFALETGFPLIVKPVDRSGSRGVTRVDSQRELHGAIAHAFHESFVKEIVIEAFITGVEVSVESISWDGEHHILAMTDKVTSGAPHFIELEHHQPSLLSDEIQLRIRTIVPVALDALDITFGASHTELIVDSEGQVWLTEIGARMGGDMIGSHLVPLSTGFDFIGAVIDVATGSGPGVRIAEKGAAGILYWNPPNGTIARWEDRTAEFSQIVEHAVFLEPGQRYHGALHSGERAGYAIYHSNGERFPHQIHEIFAAHYS